MKILAFADDVSVDFRDVAHLSQQKIKPYNSAEPELEHRMLNRDLNVDLSSTSLKLSTS